jgi:tRNA-Thr(GGU) m(6)t(6)A37 methyltransferase TsaA
LSGVVNFIGVVEKVDGEFSTISVEHRYIQGIEGLECYRRLYIIYWLHEADKAELRSTLKVIPRRHGATEPRGVFATHSPHRPNPIGLTIVDLVSVEGNKLVVRGLDAFEGSPIIDIKPEEHN